MHRSSKAKLLAEIANRDDWHGLNHVGKTAFDASKVPATHRQKQDAHHHRYRAAIQLRLGWAQATRRDRGRLVEDRIPGQRRQRHDHLAGVHPGQPGPPRPVASSQPGRRRAPFTTGAAPFDSRGGGRGLDGPQPGSYTARKDVSRRPRPTTSTTTRSPPLSQTGSGIPAMTPAGVPVIITSPGRSVK